MKKFLIALFIALTLISFIGDLVTFADFYYAWAKGYIHGAIGR